jgi:hypothetical protein
VVLQPCSCKPGCGGRSPLSRRLLRATLKSAIPRHASASPTVPSRQRPCPPAAIAARPCARPYNWKVVAEEPVGPKPCHAALACTVLPLQLLHPFPLNRVDRREVPNRMRPVSPGCAASPPCSRSSPLSSQSRRIPRRTQPPDAPEPPHGSRPASRARTCLSLAFSSLHPLKVVASGNPGTVHPVVRAGLTPPRSDLNTQLKSIYDLLSCVTSGTRSRKLLFEP